ncbi:unnamed protein product [Heligmosomoides polygyrus]|uniref:Resolvase/invertase-type recombinase catalytic domain-containing protein n=1 Tax=Heligmosomoides polygyrus TaxID=6339 RepID=A0A183F242_HELPZ|nr:unnamed protein product [Heligmosomoides polygyrus]
MRLVSLGPGGYSTKPRLKDLDDARKLAEDVGRVIQREQSNRHEKDGGATMVAWNAALGQESGGRRRKLKRGIQ